MQVSKTKTVRFSQLVKESGQPEPVTLWTAPEESPDFMKAVKQGRILSVRQDNVGAKKDFGVVGFLKEKNIAYLLFSKPLSGHAEKRVVGIKYEMLEPGKPDDPVKPFVASRKKSPAHRGTNETNEPKKKEKQIAQPSKPKPLPRFNVVVNGSKDFLLSIEAPTLAAARELAGDRVKTGEKEVRTVEMKLTIKSARKS